MKWCANPTLAPHSHPGDDHIQPINDYTRTKSELPSHTLYRACFHPLPLGAPRQLQQINNTAIDRCGQRDTIIGHRGPEVVRHNSTELSLSLSLSLALFTIPPAVPIILSPSALPSLYIYIYMVDLEQHNLRARAQFPERHFCKRTLKRHQPHSTTIQAAIILKFIVSRDKTKDGRRSPAVVRRINVYARADGIL